MTPTSSNSLLTKNSKESILSYFLCICLGIGVLTLLSGLYIATKSIASGTFDISNMNTIMSNTSDLYNLQILQAIGLFIVPPLLYAIFRKKDFYIFYNLNKSFDLRLFLIILFILAVSYPFLSYTENLLRLIPFPNVIKQFADVIDLQHQNAMKAFLVFNSFGQFLKVFFIISILAGFSEELFFRGFTMNVWLNRIRWPHLIIWLQGILFGLVHFNFYQIFALIFIGVGFGYVAYYTRNLWISITLHMLNNGIQISLYYLYQLKISRIDVDQKPDIPWYLALVSFALMAIGILYLSKSPFINKSTEL